MKDVEGRVPELGELASADMLRVLADSPKGTTFRVELPIVQPAPEDAATTSQSAAR